MWKSYSATTDDAPARQWESLRNVSDIWNHQNFAKLSWKRTISCILCLIQLWLFKPYRWGLFASDRGRMCLQLLLSAFLNIAKAWFLFVFSSKNQQKRKCLNLDLCRSKLKLNLKMLTSCYRPLLSQNSKKKLKTVYWRNISCTHRFLVYKHY